MTLTRRDLLKSATLTAAALAAKISSAETAPVVVSPPQRRLLAGWEYYRGALGGTWDIWRKDNNDTVLWQTIQMPHCVNARDAVDPDQPYYEGPAWYRTKIKLANPYLNGRTLLHFEGAGQRSEIYVASSKVGEHTGGYDEFFLDITEAVKSHTFLHNEIPVAVMCDNSRDLESIPSDLNDFPRYGGLYRFVNLIYASAISLERVHVDVNMQSAGAVSISIKAKLYNPVKLKEDVQLQCCVFAPGGTLIQTFQKQLPSWAEGQEIASFDLTSPKLWSPSTPALYRCEVSLSSGHGESKLIETFGCRYFEFQDYGAFKLNGERLLLKGTQREEDHALLGAAMTEDLVAKEFQLIKEMGANFIRLGHHQQSRAVLRLCDELGLLVWEEIPWSRGGLGGEIYKQQAKTMLTSMIEQHYNHPSIIIWGLGNELDWPGDFPEFTKSTIRAFLQELNAAAHQLDPSRKTALRRCDFASDVPDVYSPSLWAGWYGEPYTKYKESALRESKRAKHVVFMEWGGESHAGRHAEDSERSLVKYLSGQITDEKQREFLLNCGQTNPSITGDWSETYICSLFDWILKEQEAMPWLAGSAQWIFKDFATPLRAKNPIPHVNEKGLSQRDLTLKESYFVFQSRWSDKPMAHIYGHSWPIRWGDEQEEKLVKVYSNCERAELFLNNVSCGVKIRNSQDFPAAGLRWLLTFRSGDNYLRAVGQQNGKTIVDELHFQYQTAKWQHPARLELREIARSNGIATIEARIYDGNNIPCLDARNQIRFEIAGDGILLDNTGTVTGSRVVEVSNGRAEIFVQIKGNKSAVSASSQNLETTILELR